MLCRASFDEPSARTFATPQAAYANPLWCCDAASRLHNSGEVAQFLHKTGYAICDASLLSHTASPPCGSHNQFYAKVGQQKIPRHAASGYAGFCDVATRLVCAALRQDRLSFAQAGESASGCPPARRTRLVCDCSSLSPLTLKPLRSPTPRPFTAIATALLSGYAAHAAARSMVTATVASGLGSSVASLPQCRRGAFSASISAVRRLPQGRYAM